MNRRDLLLVSGVLRTLRETALTPAESAILARVQAAFENALAADCGNFNPARFAEACAPRKGRSASKESHQ